MKWKDLSLKERKQIYDTVRADNPNATYFDIKKEFDTIPEYEEGKGSRWYENKHTRDSISNVQEQYWLNRNNDANKFKSPSLEELANDTTVSGSSEKVDKEVNLVMNALRNQINNNTLEASVKNATISNYDNRVKRLEPIKEVAKVSSILGQMALGGGSIVAKEAGNLALGAALQGASALWDGIEAIQNINNNDKLGIVQNVVPIISQGLTTLKYLPSKYNNSLTNNLQSIGSNLDPIWVFGVNPIMESYKSNKESNSIEVPSYEEGGKIKLPPENVPGTPEYFTRQKEYLVKNKI